MVKESVFKGIQGAVSFIFEKALHRWVSVMEPGMSFSAILKANGASDGYATAMAIVLERLGLIEREGSRSSLRYRYEPKGDIIPDVSIIAEEIIAVANTPKNEPKCSAPKKTKPQRDVDQSGVPNRRGNVLYSIGDSAYVLICKSGEECDQPNELCDPHAQGTAVRIVEAKIVGIYRDPETGRYIYTLVYNFFGDDTVARRETINAPLKALYASPEDVGKALAFNARRFRGQLFPAIKKAKK